MSRDIVYIGKDLNFWDIIQKRIFATYPEEIFEFHEFVLSEGNFNQTILELYRIKPKMIYIDIGAGETLKINFGMFLKRTEFFKYIPVTALATNEEFTHKLIASQFDFVFIKGVETHDVVFHPFKLKFLEEAKSGEFALATLDEEVKLKEICRVGYYGLSYIHLEALNTFKNGKVVEVEHNFSPDHMKTKYFTVKNSGDTNLYYGFKNWVELDCLYTDPAVDEEGNICVDVERLSEDQLSRRMMVSKKMKRWVKDNSEYGSRKLTKILMIDKKLSVFNITEEKIDSYGYVLRVHDEFSQEFTNLKRLSPDIIVYRSPDFEQEQDDESEDVVIDDDPEIRKALEDARALEEVDFHKRQDQLITELVAEVKKTATQHGPFIILFNCNRVHSKEFQRQYNYPFSLVNSHDVNLDLLQKMTLHFEEKRLEREEMDIKAKIAQYRKKDPVKYAKIGKAHFDPPKYYVSKRNDLSHAMILRDAHLNQISESTVFFSTAEEIEFGNYYLTHPFNFAVKVVPQDGKPFTKEGDKFVYQGLIHAIGEVEKMRLRQFVNDIYTSHKKEIREKEMAEIQQINEKFIEEKAAREAEARAALEGTDNTEELEEQQTSDSEESEENLLDKATKSSG